jgi:pyruvate carboxylase subunit B
MKTNPIKFTDVTFRDGQQSLISTRLTIEDMKPIAADMDKAGFYSIEVFGGATFDVSVRYLNEDPWEKVRILRRLMPNTKLQMLLRGQNLVGYRHYADDVVKAFVRYSAEVGIDIFRIFDALNDERNIETALRAVKECGKHAQLAISYSLNEEKLGGSIFNLDYYINKARMYQNMGADSICIKDMAGLMSPDDTYNLVKALKGVLTVPLQLHSHCTSGMATMCYLKAIEAGIDILDVALSPLAMRSSLPAVEPFILAMKNTDRDSQLELKYVIKLADYIESIVKKYSDFMDNSRLSIIDTGVLVHQVPGGMITNLIYQLKVNKSIGKLGEVLAEIPRVRKDIGYPPLVTPTSQIVGAQALQNILFGRYKIVSIPFKNYVRGLYGRTPGLIDPKVKERVLKGYKTGGIPITSRPADNLKPEMQYAAEATSGIAKDIGDVLIYALFHNTGLDFLKAKYNLRAIN